MELSTLQIDLFKSLAGLVLTAGIITVIGVSIKLVVDKLPTSFLEKVL